MHDSDNTIQITGEVLPSSTMKRVIDTSRVRIACATSHRVPILEEARRSGRYTAEVLVPHTDATWSEDAAVSDSAWSEHIRQDETAKRTMTALRTLSRSRSAMRTLARAELGSILPFA